VRGPILETNRRSRFYLAFQFSPWSGPNYFQAFSRATSIPAPGCQLKDLHTGQYMRLTWRSAVPWVFFSIYVILKTRRYIRERSGIPEKSCQGCEDCCCAYWCGCCTLTQMARHTAEYETYAGQCCSETGLPVSAPQLQFGGAHIV